MTKYLNISALYCLIGLFCVAPVYASTLQDVQDEGLLRCGIRDSGSALSYINEEGRWAGFFPDICRAIAVAVLQDKDSVEFIETEAASRFTSLREKEFDVLGEAATWTLGRDADGLDFSTMYLFDGQGFMVYKPTGITNIKGLKGKKICVQTGTTTLGNLKDYNEANQMGMEILEFDTLEGSFSALFDHRCDALTQDVLTMSSIRKAYASNPDEYLLLSERISKEPLSAVVRSGDAQWADIVRWVINTLIEAEELGITQANIEEMKKSQNKSVLRFLGLEGNLGEALGLDPQWAAHIILEVGNYGEIYERTLKKDLNVDRGINNLWTKGGLIWSPPMR